MPNDDPIYKMKMHEVRNLDQCHNITVIRVHGGWIYYSREHTVKDHVIVDTILSDGVYVPFIGEKINHE